MRVVAVRSILINLIGVWLGLALGCGAGTGPSGTPTPTPSPTYPRGKPNATAFENLDLIRSLERATGRQTLLTGVAGPANQAGRVEQGNGWTYGFHDMAASRSWGWRVDFEGMVTSSGPNPIIGRAPIPVDIGSLFAIDSPRAAQLGREYGAQPWVDRYRDAFVRMTASYDAGRLSWQLDFESHSAPPCRTVIIYIDATSGELLARNLTCLTSLSQSQKRRLPVRSSEDSK